MTSAVYWGNKATNKTKTFSQPWSTEFIPFYISIILLAEVEDVVSATLFLLSDHSSMINGIVMPVDGGMTGTI